jgi:hypothetical protein
MNAFHYKTSIVSNRRCQLHHLNFPDFRVSAISEALRDDVCLRRLYSVYVRNMLSYF